MHLFSFLAIDFSKIDPYPAELFSSLCVILLLIIICIVVKIKSKKVDPLKISKGIMLLAEMFVTFIDGMVAKNMGKQFVKHFAPVIGLLSAYLFLSFIWGLTGFASPVNLYVVPLIMGIITFLGIHIVSAIYTKSKYFKRYISPMAFFLPINLISMWAPILSLSFRIFGNALAGWIIMKIIYGVFSLMQVGAINLGFLALVITPVFHAYFDLFSGFIQTVVYIMLTMLLINSEVPDEYQQLETDHSVDN